MQLQHDGQQLRAPLVGAGRGSFSRCWLLAFAVLAAVLPQGAEAESECIKMYTTAFKGHARIAPDRVGELFLKYCKKNMKSGSVKSMDELCAPIVKKVEDKMIWVPKDTAVTPEIVCKNVDQLKEAYPEHSKTALDNLSKAQQAKGVIESAKKELADKAKVLGSKIAEELKTSLAKDSEKMVADLKQRITTHVEASLGPMDSKKEKIVKEIMETVTLGMRGLETKANQKKEDAMKTWLQAEASAIVKQMKEKADL